jgi:hypothetical protein
MTRQLEMLLGSININADQVHPNKMRFRGVLVRLDEPSTRPPNGAEGHRIFVPTDVATKRLSTLVGMGLNYAEDLDGHAQRRKVGVIQKAYIKGKDLWVEGIVWKHDFPEALSDLKQRNLGMSMEIGQVEVDDTQADVWVLNDFYFLGATILFRDAAAYNRTQAIAAQADKRSVNMVKKTAVKKPVSIDAQKIASIATQAAVEGVSKHFASTLTRQTKILAGMAGQFEELNGRLSRLEASYDINAAEEEEDVDAGEEVMPKMATKKVSADGNPFADKKKDEEVEAGEEDDEEEEDDDEEIESEAIATGDLEEMGPDTPGGDLGAPGQHNEDDENKGSRTTVQDTIGKTVSSSVLVALRRQVNTLTKNQAILAAENKKLKKSLKNTSRQVTAAAKDTERRSRPMYPEITGLLSKAGVDPHTMAASAQKLTVSEVDALIASSLPNVDVTTRMTLKNKFLEMGLMEEGRLNRGTGLMTR